MKQITIDEITYDLDAVEDLKNLCAALKLVKPKDFLRKAKVTFNVKPNNIKSIKEKLYLDVEFEDRGTGTPSTKTILAKISQAIDEKIQLKEKELVKDPLQDKQVNQAAKTALQPMVEAYSAAISKDTDNNGKETKFIEELKKGLGINRDVPAGFDKAAKDCFTDLCRIHKNKGQGVDLEINDITPRTWGQATRDFLVMLLEIVLFPLGIARAAGSDAMVTNSSSKQSAFNYSTGFQKMVENQKSKPTEDKQI